MLFSYPDLYKFAQTQEQVREGGGANFVHTCFKIFKRVSSSQAEKDMALGGYYGTYIARMMPLGRRY